MTAKHTLGEWEADHLAVLSPWKKITTGLGGSERLHICICKNTKISREENEANARLIAAAPEMLEALENISKGEGRYSKDKLTHASNTIEDMIKIAETAIRKAKGE